MEAGRRRLLLVGAVLLLIYAALYYSGNDATTGSVDLVPFKAPTPKEWTASDDVLSSTTLTIKSGSPTSTLSVLTTTATVTTTSLVSKRIPVLWSAVQDPSFPVCSNGTWGTPFSANATAMRQKLEEIASREPSVACAIDLLTTNLTARIVPLFANIPQMNTTGSSPNLTDLRYLNTLPIYIPHYSPMKERRNHMEQFLSPLGVNAHLVVGWDRENLTREDYACIAPESMSNLGKRYPSEPGQRRRTLWRRTPLKRGEISLSVKHHAAFLDLLRRGYKHALILEDDITVEPELVDLQDGPATVPAVAFIFQTLLNVMKDVPTSNYSFIYAGTCQKLRSTLSGAQGHGSLADSQKELNFTLAKPLIFKAEVSRCTHAYMVSAEGAFRMMSGLPIWHPIDHAMNGEGPGGKARGENLVRMAIEPPLFAQLPANKLGNSQIRD